MCVFLKTRYGTGINLDKLCSVGIDNEDRKLKPVITVRSTKSYKYIALEII